MGHCKDCKHRGAEDHHQFRDLRECTLINEKAIPSVIELGTVLLESGDYASSDAKLWVDGGHGCALFEPKEGLQMSDTYQDTDHRYLHDPAFRAAVKTLEQIGREHGFTPGELKQIAFKAALNIEETRRPMLVIMGPRAPAQPVRTVTSYRELCDYMGWLYTEAGQSRWDSESTARVHLIPVEAEPIPEGPAALWPPAPPPPFSPEPKVKVEP